MVEIDTSELRGKWFKCIDGCGLCCLCQPELLPLELKDFRGNPGLAGVVVRSDGDPARKSIAMLKNGGPCVMLKERKCTIYRERPHFCRQFPVHTHLMWRIQLTPDYSCRGIWREDWGDGKDGFVDLEKYGLDELHRYSGEKLEVELKDANEVFEEFRRNSIDNGVWREAGELRSKTASLIGDGFFSDLDGLGSILLAVQHAREDELDVFDILRATGKGQNRRESLNAMRELSEELLTVSRIEENPIYVDGSLNWNVYNLVNGKIWKRRLLDRGGLSNISQVELDISDISVSAEGERALTAYSIKSNSRDAFMGFVCYLVDDADYDIDLLSTYLENMAMTQLDLVMRSAIVQPERRRSIGREQVAEGVVYIDMDMHDAPTIGSVI